MERATLETSSELVPGPAPDATPQAGGGSIRPPRSAGLPPPATFKSATEERLGDPADPGPAWAEAAPELADWALRTVVIRTDAFGTYRRFEVPGGGSKVVALTSKDEPTREVLVRHFAGATPEGRVGVHLIDPIDSTCRGRGRRHRRPRQRR